MLVGGRRLGPLCGPSAMSSSPRSSSSSRYHEVNKKEVVWSQENTFLKKWNELSPINVTVPNSRKIEQQEKS